MLLHREMVDRCIVNAAFEVLIEIGVERPQNMRNAIKEKHVVMLIPVNWLVGLRIAMS